jgi:hypothetical protein
VPPDQIVQLVAVFVCVLTPFVVIGTYAVIYPAVQAYKRGYNPFVWGLAGILAVNPIFLLVVLGLVPNRRRMKLREEYAEDLDEWLAEAGIAPPTAPVGVPVRDVSIGDEATRLPGRSILRSIGDQATELPRDRSIGDDQTRM